MIEIKARVSCETPECSSVEEYWAVISVDTVYDSDTFGSRDTPEISVSAPNGWGLESGFLGPKTYCPTCVEKMTATMRKRVTVWRSHD